MMSLMGIAIVSALSYNMLLGQTGMLSFGHAVYYGLGAYLVVHAINIFTAKGSPYRCRWSHLLEVWQVSFSASSSAGSRPSVQARHSR